MTVKRKTVRFQDTASDMAVYDAISDYRSLGSFLFLCILFFLNRYGRLFYIPIP